MEFRMTSEEERRLLGDSRRGDQVDAENMEKLLVGELALGLSRSTLLDSLAPTNGNNLATTDSWGSLGGKPHSLTGKW